MENGKSGTTSTDSLQPQYRWKQNVGKKITNKKGKKNEVLSFCNSTISV
jgi:hypothetical protein